jgi:hypothetical protein
MQGAHESAPVSGIEKATLKFLRFKCHYVDSTVEFYTSLAMNLDQRKDGVKKTILFFSYHSADDTNCGLLFEKDHVELG